VNPQDQQQPDFENNEQNPVKPLENNTSVTPVVVPEIKKSKKKLFIIIAVILLIAGAGVAFLMLKDKDTNNSVESESQSTSQENSAETADSSPADSSSLDGLSKVLNDYLEEALKAEFVVKEDATASGIVFYYSETDRYIDLSSSEGLFGYLMVNDSENGEQTVGELKDLFGARLKEVGFEKYSAEKSYYELSEYIRSEMYKKDDNVCMVRINDVDSAPSYLTYSCVDYSLLPKEAETMEQFYLAYDKAEPEYSKSTLIVINEIKPSVTSGYEVATGGLGGIPEGGGAGGVFYRKTEGTWQFGFGAQSMPMCSTYDSEDMRLALADDYCYNDDTQEETTVSKYYSL
jgi:hypothetical protein